MESRRSSRVSTAAVTIAFFMTLFAITQGNEQIGDGCTKPDATGGECCECRQGSTIYYNDIGGCKPPETPSRKYKNVIPGFNCKQTNNNSNTDNAIKTSTIGIATTGSNLSMSENNTTPSSETTTTSMGYNGTASNGSTTTTTNPSTTVTTAIGGNWFVFKDCAGACESCKGPSGCLSCLVGFTMVTRVYTGPTATLGTRDTTSSSTTVGIPQETTVTTVNVTIGTQNYSITTDSGHSVNQTTHSPTTTSYQDMTTIGTKRPSTHPRAPDTTVNHCQRVSCRYLFPNNTCNDLCPDLKYILNATCTHNCPHDFQGYCIDQCSEKQRAPDFSGYCVDGCSEKQLAFLVKHKKTMTNDGKYCVWLQCDEIEIEMGDTCVSFLLIILPIAGVLCIVVVVVVLVVIRRRRRRQRTEAPNMDMQLRTNEEQDQGGKQFEIPEYGNIPNTKGIARAAQRKQDDMNRYTQDPVAEIERSRALRSPSTNPLLPNEDFGAEYVEMTSTEQKLNVTNNAHGYVNASPEGTTDDYGAEYGNVIINNPPASSDEYGGDYGNISINDPPPRPKKYQDENPYGNLDPINRNRAEVSFRNKKRNTNNEHDIPEDLPSFPAPAPPPKDGEDFGGDYEAPGYSADPRFGATIDTGDQGYGETYETPDQSANNTGGDFGETYESPAAQSTDHNAEYGETYETPDQSANNTGGDFGETYEVPDYQSNVKAGDYGDTYEAPSAINPEDYGGTYEAPSAHNTSNNADFGGDYENHGPQNAPTQGNNEDDFGGVYANTDFSHGRMEDFGDTYENHQTGVINNVHGEPEYQNTSAWVRKT